MLTFIFLLKRAPLKIFDIWEYFSDYKASKTKKFFLFIVKCFHSLFKLLSDLNMLYHTIYIVVSILGLTIHPFFYAFLLAEIFKLEELKYVINALWKAKYELFFAVILMLIIIYYFALFSYSVFHDHFEGGICESLWKCFATTYDWTFKY